MSDAGWSAWSLILGAVLGCGGPALDLPEARSQSLALDLEPFAELNAVPLALRGRVRAAPAGDAWLFRGELSDYHDSAVRRGEVPMTLRERAVPLRHWRDGDDCVVQPLVWLEPGVDYALAFAGHGRAATLRTASEPAARAERYFPSGELERAVALCGGELSAELPAQVLLEPGGIPLDVMPGVFGFARADCVTLASARAPDEPALLPPSLAGVLLEPSVLAARPEPASEPLDLSIEDDRVLVNAGESGALWLLTQPQPVALALAPFERGLLLSGLAASSTYTLAGQVVHTSGQVVPLSMPVETQAPRRHLVLNEVLSNAVGAEPESEWIEIVNDGALPVSLSELWLEDAGGAFPVPDGELGPGELALLVAASFRRSALDVSPAASIRLIRLPSLGARGLSNSGEPLLLVGREGVLSRFPAISAGVAGRSVARRTLATADDDPRGFAQHAKPGASPGAPNSLE